MGENCGKESGCCKSEADSCCESGDDYMEKGDFLNELADEAWSELMTEKIKKVLEKAHGEKMNKTAQVIAEARHSFWVNKMKAKAEQEAWEEKVRQSMME